MLSRRRFLQTGVGAAASICLPSAPSLALEDVVLSQPLKAGLDGTQYARYAARGPYSLPGDPLILSMPEFPHGLFAFSPISNDPLPVLLFSSTGLMAPSVYFRLIRHWASHGFFVVAPIHNDAYRNDVFRIEAYASDKTSSRLADLAGDHTLWIDRVDAMRVALNKIEAISAAANVSLLGTNTLVVGHGFGAQTAALLGGAGYAYTSNGKPLVDARIFASLMISPPMPGQMGLSPQAISQIDVPSMLVTGDQDTGPLPGSDSRYSEFYQVLHASPRHRAIVRNQSFLLPTGAGNSTSSKQALAFEDMRAATTAFLYAYGKEDESAYTDMTSGIFRRFTDLRLTIDTAT